MIRIGTRGSELALCQAGYVAGLIGKDKTEIKIIRTKGDKIQNISFDKMEGKAFFTKEIEDALLKNEIDIAVHSMKDLPTDDVNGLLVAAVLKREDPSDILLISPGCYNADNFLNLYNNAIVGTSSLRRLAQIRNAMPSLDVQPLRGNVTTRIEKLREGRFDAIILASAGLKRLNLDLKDLKLMPLPYSFFLPAPSQGALAVQIRENDIELRDLLAGFDDADTRKSVGAERSFLRHFGGGCHIPLGALAYISNSRIHLSGVIASVDGFRLLRDSVEGDVPGLLGEELANRLKEKGAEELL